MERKDNTHSNIFFGLFLLSVMAIYGLFSFSYRITPLNPLFSYAIFILGFIGYAIIAREYYETSLLLECQKTILSHSLYREIAHNRRDLDQRLLISYYYDVINSKRKIERNYFWIIRYLLRSEVQRRRHEFKMNIRKFNAKLASRLTLRLPTKFEMILERLRN